MTRKPGSQSLRTKVSASLDAFEGPISTLRRDVARAGRTGWHSHPCGEVLYATAGLMVISTQESIWMVPTGFALILAPEVGHDSACEGPLSLCAAFIDTDFFQNATRGASCRLIRVSPLLDAALRGLAEDREEGPYGAGDRIELLTSVVAMELARAESVEFGLPIPDDRRLRRICTLLMEEPSLEGDIDHWAARAGLSRRTMTRRFREETSLSFAEWRRRLRTAAAAMETSKGVPFPKVANLVGYKTVHGLRGMIRKTTDAASGAA